MRKINVGNDYAFRDKLKAQQNKKKNDNNPTAGTEAAGPTEKVEQTDTQETAKEETEEKKKGRGKKEKK